MCFNLDSRALLRMTAKKAAEALGSRTDVLFMAEKNERF